MRSADKLAIAFLVAFSALVLLALLVRGHTIAVLQPQGLVAKAELTLMINAILLMLIVALPMLSMAFFFAWWYRADNERAMYSPNWEHGIMTELVWWVIPLEIVLVLGAVTWTSTHTLDPHKALAVQDSPLKIQVVALNWKWLFIYPEQHIATINYIEFPVRRPVEFDITADAPMNSFWIPQLGGQMYAMTGMVTQLNLVADTLGIFVGSSANYSGDGFAKMKFTASAVSESDFNDWVQSVKMSSTTLDSDAYERLEKPNVANPPSSYASVPDNFFSTIVAKFMPAAMQDMMH